MVVPCLFAAQPILVICLGEVGKSLLGNMEPSRLICCEDQTFKDGEDPLQSFVGAHHNYSFCEHFLRGVVSKGEVRLWIVGDVKVGGFL